MLAACTAKLQPPTAAIAGPSTAHVGVAVSLDGSASAPGPTSESAVLPISFQWSFVAVPPGSAAALNQPTLVQPSFIPDLAGDYVVQLIVSDGVFSSAPAKLTVKATDDCRPVVAKTTAAPSQPAVGEAIALSFEPGPACADAGSKGVLVSWKWVVVSAPAGSAAEIAHAASPNASFVPDRRGDYELALQVTDALGLASDALDPNAHVKFSAQACGDNAPEVAEITPAPTNPNVQQTVQLAATVTHADTVAPCTFRRSLTWAWALNALPAGSRARLNEPSAINPSFTPDVAGDYVVGLTVRDELGRSSQQRTFVIKTTECGAAVPVVTAVTPADAFAGQGIQLGARVADADNAAASGLNVVDAPADANAAAGTCNVALSFRYQWSLLAAPAGSKAALNDAGLANPSFVTDVAGDYLLSVVATASTGKTSAPSFATIHVSECGSLKPQVSLVIPPGAITSAPVRLSANVTDPNASCRATVAYRYAWSLASAPAGSVASLSGAAGTGVSAEQTPSLVPDLPGSYVVHLVVNDSAGLASDRQDATIEVGHCNAPLAVMLDAPTGAVTGTAVALSANVVDPNAPASAPPVPDAGTLDPDAGTPDLDAGTVDAGTTCSAAVLPYAYAWSLVGLPAGSNAVVNNAAASAPSFVADLAGTYRVRLVVTDAAGNRSPPVETDVVVANCTAPLSVEIASVQGAAVGVTLPLTATVADPNEPSPDNSCTRGTAPFRYAWRLGGLPAGSHARLNDGASVAPSFVPDVAGTYTVALQVTDALGNTSPIEVATIDVSATCRAPLTAVISGASKPVGVPVAFSAAVTDPNTPSAQNGCVAATAPYAYAWSLVGLPLGSRAALNNAGSASPTLVPDVEGTYSVALVVIDAAGNASTVTGFDFATSGRCTAPLEVAIDATSGAAAGVPVGLSAVVIDSNTPSATNGCTAPTAPYDYTWSLVGLPTGSLATLNNTASAGPSFTPDVVGTYAVALWVQDAAGNRSPRVVSNIEVSDTCTAPVSASIAAVNGAAAGVPVSLSASVTDPNTPAPGNNCTRATAPFSYAWSLVGLPAGSRATLNNGASSAPSFTPDLTGAYAFSLVVTDAAGNRSPAATATVTVASSCRAPLTASITAPAASAVGLPLSFSASVVDPNTPSATNGCVAVTEPYAYRWALVGLPSSSRATLNNATSSAPGLVPDAAGAYSVELSVVDAAGNAGPIASVTVNVSASCRVAPTAAIDAPTGAAVGLPLALGATVSDPNAPGGAAGCVVATTPFQYAWSIVGLPLASRAALNNASSVAPTFTPDVAGTYTVALVATDAAGNRSATATRDIVVSSSCVAPLTATITAPAGAGTGTPVQVSATVTDPNTPSAANACTVATAPIAYAWSLVGVPAGSKAVLNSPVVAAPSFTPDVAGIYTIALVATDAAGNASATITKAITVADCSAPLTVTVTQAGTASTLQTLTFTAAIVDAAAASCGTKTPYTYTWTLTGRPGRSTAGVSPAGATATLVPDVAGTYALSVKATNALGSSGTGTISVAATGCGGGANIAAAIKSTVNAPIVRQRVDLAAVVSDTNQTACGQPTAAPFSYAWTLTPPAGSSTTLNGANTVSPWLVPDTAGTYTVSYTVTDALGYQATTTSSAVVVDCTPTVTLTQNITATTFSSVRVNATVAFPVACASPPPVTYRWSFDSMPLASTATFVNNAATSGVFTADAVGTWNVRLALTDTVTNTVTNATTTVTTGSCGGSGPVARIAVTGLAAAAFNATPSAATAIVTTNGTAVQLDGTGSLAPNIPTCLAGPLTYQWVLYAVPAGSGASIRLDSAAKPSLTFDRVGEFIVQLVVNDGAFTSAPTYVRFTVN